MLFHKRTKSVIKVFWTIIAVLVGLSMVLLYAPFFQRTTPRHTIQQEQPEEPAASPEPAPAEPDVPDITFSPTLP